MNMGTIADWATVVVAVAAVFYAKNTWSAGRYAVKAAAFDARWQIHEATRKFIGVWLADGRPDLKLLPELIGAWDQSRYLFQPRVTKALRQLWLDAVDAAQWDDIIGDKAPGDRDQAIEKKYELLRRISDDRFMFDVFYEELHVSEPVRAGLFVIR